VTADVGDRKSLLGDPPAGLLAQPGNPESLADKIIQVLSDPAVSSSLQSRGFDRVKNYYWDKLANDLNELVLEHK
jgi:glycosyltransferase involved in cell wall biosynthesis